MKNKGFTLIEILAIIMLLAVLALIATPVVSNIIGSAKRKANIETANGLIDSAELYYSESMLDKDKQYNVDNLNNIYELVVVTGVKPDVGKLFVDSDGQVALSVTIDEYCYVKQFNGQLQEFASNDEKCNLGYVGTDDVAPTLEYEITGTVGNNGWYKTFVNVTIKPSDSNSGIDYFKWCSGINCVPSSTETNLNKTLDFRDTEQTQVCAEAFDKMGNSSGKICSDILRIDTVAPEFTGIADIVVAVGGSVDLISGVDVTDSMSGLEGTYEIDTETVETDKSGVTEVTYTAVDKAGNVKTIKRKVTVSSTAPSVEFIAEEGYINSNGWAKEDFYVTINVTDNSGHGIKSFSVCTEDADECEPSLGSTITGSNTTTRKISTESGNNRICVQTIDNTDLKSEIICSDAYKLDKTDPVAGTIEITGTEGSNGWYISDVTISAIDGSDALSGHLSTEVDVTSITTNTNGKLVTVTTYDKAGNSNTREYTIKVDKSSYDIVIVKSVSNNQNVLTVNTTDSISSYVWYKDGSVISGETSSSLTTIEAGTYKVKVTTSSGKEIESNEITINSYTIAYNLNGGQGSVASTTKIEDLSVNITNVTPIKTGYKFIGWGTSSTDTTVDYEKNAPYTTNSSTTLYAIWQIVYTCSTGTLTNDSSKGYICVASNANALYDKYIQTRSYKYTIETCNTLYNKTTYSRSGPLYDQTDYTRTTIQPVKWCGSYTYSTGSSFGSSSNVSTTCSYWGCSRVNCSKNPSSPQLDEPDYITEMTMSEIKSYGYSVDDCSLGSSPSCYYLSCSASASGYSSEYDCDLYIKYATYTCYNQTANGCAGYLHCQTSSLPDGREENGKDYLTDGCTPSYGSWTVAYSSTGKTSCSGQSSTSACSGTSCTVCSSPYYGNWDSGSTTTGLNSCSESNSSSCSNCTSYATCSSYESCSTSSGNSCSSSSSVTCTENGWSSSSLYSSGLTSCSESESTTTKYTCSSAYYSCPSGWSYYSGSGSSTRCYKAAD